LDALALRSMTYMRGNWYRQQTFNKQLQIQSELLKRQFTNAGQHLQQITGEIMSSARDVSKAKL